MQQYPRAHYVIPRVPVADKALSPSSLGTTDSRFSIPTNMPPELRNSTRINFLVVGPHNEKCRIWTVHTTGAVVYPPRREGLIIEALIFEIQEKVRTSLLIRFDHTDIDLYHVSAHTLLCVPPLKRLSAQRIPPRGRR